MFGLLWVLLSLIGLVVLGHILGWLRFVPIAARVFGETPWLPASLREPLQEKESVEFTAADGCRLEGTYLPTRSPRRKGVIAFCHELNGDRWSSIPYTEDLRRRGFDIFTFDFRNHGTSGHTPDYAPMPWVTTHDLMDARAAIRYLCSRPDADPSGIGLIGVSKGATVALCAAAEDSRVRTLVIDGACPTERMQLHYLRRFMQIYVSPSWLLSWLPDACLQTTGAWAKYVVGRRTNCRFVNVDQAARRLRQPVMMIHGQHDAHIPVEVVRSLRSRMSTRTKLWVVPRAKHNGSIDVAQTIYQQRIARFLNRYLASASAVN